MEKKSLKRHKRVRKCPTEPTPESDKQQQPNGTNSGKYQTTKETQPKYDTSCKFPAVTCPPGQKSWISAWSLTTQNTFGLSEEELQVAVKAAINKAMIISRCQVKSVSVSNSTATSFPFPHDLRTLVISSYVPVSRLITWSGSQNTTWHQVQTA